MAGIITYREAHRDARVRLCGWHREHSDTLAIELGPVEHGLHRGMCDACEGEWLQDHDYAVDDAGLDELSSYRLTVVDRAARKQWIDATEED